MAKRFRDELYEALRYTKFSLIIDETTDIAFKKQLAIVVHFYCDRQKRVRSLFFKLVQVTAADADHITTAVLGSFEKACIPTDTLLASLLIRQMSCLGLITRSRLF